MASATYTTRFVLSKAQIPEAILTVATDYPEQWPPVGSCEMDLATLVTV